ncbi:Hydroxyproline O-galactosyltransferase HPGT1 [Glycine max]|nr:Hydroxyproline O-galactosyltransferase HPGT1 [Glycine max]
MVVIISLECGINMKCLLFRFILRTYAHDDVSIGSWFIGLDVEHLDETKFCCSSRWSPGLLGWKWGQFAQQYDDFPLTIKVTEGSIAYRNPLLPPSSFLSQVIFRYDNFNQQLILPLECRELLVRSYASLTIDTYMLLRMFKGVEKFASWLSDFEKLFLPHLNHHFYHME